MQIEISRSMAANLCNRFDVPVPEFFHAESKEEAIEIINDNPRPYVLKIQSAPLFSPVHTIVCKTVEDTLGWIERIDDSEGIFTEIFWNCRGRPFLFSSAKAKYRAWSPTRNINVPSLEIWGLLRSPLGGIAHDPEDQYDLQKSLYTLSNLGFWNQALLVHFRSPGSRKTENGTPSNTISDLESQPLHCY